MSRPPLRPAAPPPIGPASMPTTLAPASSRASIAASPEPPSPTTQTSARTSPSSGGGLFAAAGSPQSGTAMGRILPGSALRRCGGGLLHAPREQRLARDHEALDLRSALVELHDLGVPHQLLDGIVLDEAVAAVDLDR